ncbi:cytochrome B6 [bacterium]|nr:cytochrome B6 [bacterium]
MFKRLSDWLDDRTGYRHLLEEALDEPVKGGARWRYVFGSAVTTAFMIQLVTGVLLMTSYSPSSSTAWGSVYFISYEMVGGWFVRGLHHFGAQAMVVLLFLHLLQVLIAGAYRSPREVNWWLGMVLLFITLAFSLTGYLLPWDQKGYWATKVATNIMGITPVVGPYVQKVVVGGNEYGNQTLTRFYGIHVGVLPGLLVLTLAAHIAVFRRHGVTAPEKATGSDPFWPKQVFMDTVASLAVLGVVAFFAIAERGAPLDAPAEPSSSDYPARPEWYFLSLFQMLKRPEFAGENEIIGAIIVPGAIVTALFAFPLLDKIFPRKLGHFLACSLVFALVGVAGLLTMQAWKEDAANADFQVTRAKADVARKRALFLAGHPEAGVPPEGSRYVLLNDPLYAGSSVLERKCLSCHYYDGKGVLERGHDGKMVMTKQIAADLKGFGTRPWLEGLLANPSDAKYFGSTPQLSGMAQWKKTTKLKPDELKTVTDFVAEFAKVGDEETIDDWLSRNEISEHPGLELFKKDCGRCHTVDAEGILGEGGEVEAPNLFGWGSPRWVRRMIRHPNAADRYGYLEEKDQMPGFGQTELSDREMSVLIRLFSGQYVPDDPATAAAGH